MTEPEYAAKHRRPPLELSPRLKKHLQDVEALRVARMDPTRKP